MTIENKFTAKPPGFYDPGDPLSTHYVEKLWRIANTAAGLPADQRPTMMYLSAADYGRVIAELRAQHGAPSTGQPPYLALGKNPELKVLNAGTDDEATVNRMNRDTPGAIEFEARTKQFEATR